MEGLEDGVLREFLALKSCKALTLSDKAGAMYVHWHVTVSAEFDAEMRQMEYGEAVRNFRTCLEMVLSLSWP